MNHAITMGIFWHLIGAASAACFYAPFKKVKHWSWETMWSVGGIVSWLILPWGHQRHAVTRLLGLLPLFLAPPRCCRSFCSAPCGALVISTMA
ncbi:L-rhamnose-proton symporter [Klebsiella pneumoniae]|uniref:L-rhamnose-proton symporter n=1 Tax=Klebsiella pneumoniae TaxID=573 RepID=A0A377WC41_KLEPN|nr:L-rhamnose-proton symporter [Klebsiella pneumoniae]